MHLKNTVLGVAGVTVLSGCMMPGMWHTGDLVEAVAAGQAESNRAPAAIQHAEASSAGLSITLTFATPGSGDPVTIIAYLRSDRTAQVPADGDIWLRIQTPSGRVDELRLQRIPVSAGGAYQAQYSFLTPGFYLVIAEGRVGDGTSVRTVLVTTGVQVASEPYGGRDGWLPSHGGIAR